MILFSKSKLYSIYKFISNNFQNPELILYVDSINATVNKTRCILGFVRKP